VRRLLASALPADRRQGSAHRRLLIPTEVDDFRLAKIEKIIEKGNLKDVLHKRMHRQIFFDAWK